MRLTSGMNRILMNFKHDCMVVKECLGGFGLSGLNMDLALYVISKALAASLEVASFTL